MGGFERRVVEAARCGSAATLRTLLESDAAAAVAARDRVGDTALHLAARLRSGECASLLLDAGADRDAAGVEGQTPLHDAARVGRRECVALLLRAGANPNAKTREGLTPLHLATRYSNADCATLLLAAGADAESRSAEGLTAMHMAAEACSIPLVTALLDGGANVNASTACQREPQNSGSSIWWTDDDYVRETLGAGARGAGGSTPLHIAVRCGEPRCVRLLLARGADANARNAQQHTPLHCAVQAAIEYGPEPECVSVLLAFDADPTLTAPYTWDGVFVTPADLARRRATQTLLRRAEQRARLTPLMSAAARGAIFDPRLFDARLWRVVGRFL